MVPNELPPASHSPPVERCGPAPEPNAQPRERLPRPTECSVSLDAEARGACMLALSAVAHSLGQAPATALLDNYGRLASLE